MAAGSSGLTPPTFVILAGGQSRRMGTDKAGLTQDGETLLARTARIGREAGLPIWVVGRDRPDGWAQTGVEFLQDGTPAQGPLGGLAVALARAGGDVLAVGCDLPRLSVPAVRWLLEARSVWPGAPGVVTGNGHQTEPLFAVYGAACAALAARRLAEGRRSLMGLIEEAGLVRAEAPVWVADAIRNVNTPEDWRHIRGDG